jgi:diketogulonate reductase-like aldo/keto reductase
LKYLELDGDKFPALGFGTYELSGVTCRHAVRTALDAGYRHIDTARMYDNEGDVGGAITESGLDREAIFLTTKIWREDLSPDAIRAEVDSSLMLLDTDYVDLLLVHWPNPDHPLHETLGCMMEMQEAGRTRHVGVSNFTPSLLEEALEIAPICCNQVEYHPLLDQSPLLEVVRKRNLVLTAYSPLAQGNVLGEEAVARIARRHDRSPAQIVLRWHVQQPGVAAIPRSGNDDHIRKNLEVFDFELSEEEMATLSGMARGERQVDPAWAPTWGT